MDDSQGWAPTHRKTFPMVRHFHLTHSVSPEYPPQFDDTREGWRRDGWWITQDNAEWERGLCDQFYNRTCSESEKAIDLRTLLTGAPVNDTMQAFYPRVNVTNEGVWVPSHLPVDGRWREEGGECVDQVLLGCFNNGTCVAPNTCECAEGWEGHDCSIPVCSHTVTRDVTIKPENPETQALLPYTTLLRSDGVNKGLPPPGNEAPFEPGDTRVYRRLCANNGNCTHPDTCTCEKGWTGPDCSTPVCAQECFNGGNCTAPDLCTCPQWWNRFRDNRIAGGRPIYRKADGDPMNTGWTGFDCNTPICVQAEKWVPIYEVANVSLVSTINDGTTFQAGCEPNTRFTPPNRTRVSDMLCGVAGWYEGVYEDTTANGPGSVHSKGRGVRVNYLGYRKTEERDSIGREIWEPLPVIPGEGIFACYNGGSCVAPDTCECSDGWEGFDCNTPICRHENYYGETVGCLNGGICSGKDECICITGESILHEAHPEMPKGAITGYAGADCSMAICAQGWYDPDCKDVPPGPGGVSSGGEGCYRCPNGGYCTAPDYCSCPSDWTGYDCRQRKYSP